MALTQSQTKYLRGYSHGLKPLIMVGAKGITDSLIEELRNTLAHHELVKIKIASDNREERAQIIKTLQETTGADLVQTLGKICVLFQQKPKEAAFSLPKK